MDYLTAREAYYRAKGTSSAQHDAEVKAEVEEARALLAAGFTTQSEDIRKKAAHVLRNFLPG